MNQGEKFLPTEIETLFFDSTKLLQTTDIELRRLVYFILRVLNERQNYSFVVTSMLMNDINKNNDMYRANSFRMLGQIINSNDNINLLERYLKNVRNY
jgi:vesicle coat complex subunit